MNNLITAGIIIGTLLLFFYGIKKLNEYIEKDDKAKEIPQRKLNKKESEFMAYYFHNKENRPDIDGYVGHYTLPEEVMIIYQKKYGKDRGWENDRK